MTTDLRVALTAGLTDRLTAPMQRMLDEAEKKLGQLSRRVAETGTLSDGASNKLATLGTTANALARTTGPAKLKSDLAEVARESDRAVQNTNKLTTALGKLSGLARGATSLFAGFNAAKYVLADPMTRAANYELELAKVSNIAYADRNTVQGRQAGQRELDAAVRSATLQGVSREDALAGLKKLIASGASRSDAMTMLPTIAKFGMAGEASLSDVAAVALKAQQNFRIAPQQMPAALQMALNAGKLGQFEFKDMAHWLPEQMSIAKNMLGMKGLGDMSTLLAANQFAAMTAGNNSAAGNNLVNFLSKIGSNDTQNDAKKLGIDLTGTLVKARSEGTNPVDAFVSLLQKTAESDPQYRRLQQRLEQARSSGDKSGQEDTLSSMRDLMMGKNVGKLVQDRQALLGLLGILNDPKGFDRMRRDIAAANGGVDVDQATLMATASMKDQQGENAMLARQFDVLQGVNGALGDAKVGLAKLSAEYPSAAAALEGLKLAAMSAGVALAAMGAANIITGAATGAAGVGLGAGAAAAGVAAAAIPAVLATGAAGLAGYAGGTLLYRGLLQDTQAGDMIGGGVARLLAFFGSDEAQASLNSRQRLEEYEATGGGVGRGSRSQSGSPGGDPAAYTDPVVRAIRDLGERPVRVYLDGREIAEQVDRYSTTMFSRR